MSSYEASINKFVVLFLHNKPLFVRSAIGQRSYHYLEYIQKLILHYKVFVVFIFSEYSNEYSLKLNYNNFKQYRNIFLYCRIISAGSPYFSPYSSLSNLFAGMFEIEAKNAFQVLPRVWIRYVDNKYVVFDTNKCNVKDFVNYVDLPTWGQINNIPHKNRHRQVDRILQPGGPEHIITCN